MADVAPELLERIRSEFQRRVKIGPILRISARIRDGSASQTEVSRYARLLGEALSASLRAVLTEDALPDGRLYYNIANRTIRPMLAANHKLVNQAAIAAQKAADEAGGIGLNALEAEFPEDRVAGLVDKAAREADYELMRRWLEEPVVNCTESFYDDFVETNARFTAQSGLKATVHRNAAPGCCAWCAERIGTFDFAALKSREVFRRHEYCRCIVTFERGRERQNVWTKRTWKTPENVLQKRRETESAAFRLTSSEAADFAQEMRQRDERITAIMRERNVSRERAAGLYRKEQKNSGAFSRYNQPNGGRGSWPSG